MANANARAEARRNIGHVEYVPAKPQAERRAREKAEAWVERVRAQGIVRADAPSPAETETARTWWGRYLDHRAAKGQ